MSDRDCDRVRELENMANEIEEELESCKRNIRRLGGVTIKIQSFSNILRKMNASDSAVKQLQIKRNYFAGQLRALSDIQAREREAEEQEMSVSNIHIRKMNEVQDASSGAALQGDGFYEEQSNKLDDFILSAMDSFDAVKRQGVYIRRAHERLKTGMLRLGLSSEMIDIIERRVGQDRLIFIVLFIVVVIFILLLRICF